MKKLLIVIVVTSLLGLLVASSVRLEKDSGNILIDVSKPHKITWPCEIDFVGEDGEEGFRIGPDVTQGWRNRRWEAGDEDAEFVKADGYATYHFYIPASGDYVLWGYALWDDPCTNAIFVKIDQGQDSILGNDPVFKEWHWIRGASTHLAKGTHTLTLSNHSNNVALQKIMLMGSKHKVPSAGDEYFTDIFYDDFDGCDLGNFHQWNKVSGSWQVANYDKLACTNNNSLIGESLEGSEGEIQVGGTKWENYSFDIDVAIKEWNHGASAQIRFGENDDGRLFAINLTPSSTGPIKVQLLKNESGKDVVLGESEIAKKEFTISLDMGKEMLLLLDGRTIINADAQIYQGGVSLFLKGDIRACFDDLHIRYLESVQ